MKQQLPWIFGLVCCCLVAAGMQAQTPVASYSFSGSANDGSTFANHAAVNAASLTRDRFGISNRAMAFDGIQGSVTAPNAAQLNSANATISFWVNPRHFLPRERFTFCRSADGRSAGKFPCPRTESRYLPPTPTGPAAATWIPVRRSASTSGRMS